MKEKTIERRRRRRKTKNLKKRMMRSIKKLIRDKEVIRSNYHKNSYEEGKIDWREENIKRQRIGGGEYKKTKKKKREAKKNKKQKEKVSWKKKTSEKKQE